MKGSRSKKSIQMANQLFPSGPKTDLYISVELLLGTASRSASKNEIRRRTMEFLMSTIDAKMSFGTRS
jgi:hypothetical protein